MSVQICGLDWFHYTCDGCGTGVVRGIGHEIEGEEMFASWSTRYDCGGPHHYCSACAWEMCFPPGASRCGCGDIPCYERNQEGSPWVDEGPSWVDEEEKKKPEGGRGKPVRIPDRFLRITALLCRRVGRIAETAKRRRPS